MRLSYTGAGKAWPYWAHSGCNIGAMLSGISTGSLHGWLWVPLAFAGTLVGVRVRRHYRF